MRVITAVLRPASVPAVREALHAFGVQGLTLTQVIAHDPDRLRVEVYRAEAWVTNLAPGIRLDVLVADDDVADLVHVIAAALGRAGSGRIWTTPVLRVVRVRTGEQDENAI